MTSPEPLEPEPHFDHELERLLFVAMVWLQCLPFLAPPVYGLAGCVGAPEQLRVGFTVGIGSSIGLLSWTFIERLGVVGPMLDAGLRKLGLSPWGFPTTAVVRLSELVCRHLHIELAIDMVRWVEWEALGMITFLIGIRAVMLLRRRWSARHGSK